MKKSLLRSLLLCLLALSTLSVYAQQPADSSKSSGKKKRMQKKSAVVTAPGAWTEMIFVEGGTFKMGSEDGHDNESPVHTVTVKSFYLGMYEVTQKEWKEIMGNNPSNFKGDNLPVDNVSYNDIQKFLKKLNAKTKENYRLPTEAEWEFAARGGNSSFGYYFSGAEYVEDVAWYYDNADQKTHPGGELGDNELGFVDMSGNVSEWCNDFYDPEYYSKSPAENPKGPAKGKQRILRGGSWYNLGTECTVSNRFPAFPDKKGIDYGFRLAKDK